MSVRPFCSPADRAHAWPDRMLCVWLPLQNCVGIAAIHTLRLLEAARGAPLACGVALHLQKVSADHWNSSLRADSAP